MELEYIDKSRHEFFIETLLEIGLHPEQNRFEFWDEGQKRDMPYIRPNGLDLRFYVPTIHGGIETFTKGDPTKPKSKTQEWYLTRFQYPTTDENGDEAKYKPPFEAGMRLLFSPQVIEKFKAQKEIEVLYIVEGYKKAISGWINGLDIVGMSGLTGYKVPAKEEVNKDLEEVFTTCKVKKIVVIFDSDYRDISKKSSKAETSRPNIFYRAAIHAKDLLGKYGDVYLAAPKSDGQKLGLDDLFLKYRTYSKVSDPIPKVKKGKILQDIEKLIVNDLERGASFFSGQELEYFHLFRISGMADYNIKKIFYLDSPESFYNGHKEELKQNNRFQYFSSLYDIKPDGTISLSMEQTKEYIDIEVRNGKLYKIVNNHPSLLANFTIRVLFMIDSREDPKRICEIKNFQNDRAVLEITSKNFVSVTDFQSLMISKGNFIWKGSKEDLLDLMQMLFRQEKRAIELKTMGFQPLFNFWSWSNGIVTEKGFKPVDEYGIVSHGEKNFYLPAFSLFNADDVDFFKEERKFAHHESKDPVKWISWKRQMSRVYGDNGNIAACFYIASIYSDIICDDPSARNFPMLMSAGRPETGKSTICDSLSSMFGKPLAKVKVGGDSTAKYFITRFAQVRNGLVHLEEYSNSIPMKVIDQMKAIFDRMGYGKKAFSNDLRTNFTPILSSAIISGEEFPTTNHALFTRIILMVFNKNKYTEEERRDFANLKKMEEEGLTHLTNHLLMQRILIQQEFNKKFNELVQLFAERMTNQPNSDRIYKNAAAVLAPVLILLDNAVIEYDLNQEQLIELMARSVEKQAKIVRDNTDLRKFWNLIEILYKERKISEGAGDFKILENNTELAIRLNNIHAAYMEKATLLRFPKILDKVSLENYLTNDPAYIDRKDSKGNRKQIRFKNTAALPAFFFDYTKLGIQLHDEFGDTIPDVIPELIPEPDKDFTIF